MDKRIDQIAENIVARMLSIVWAHCPELSEEEARVLLTEITGEALEAVKKSEKIS